MSSRPTPSEDRQELRRIVHALYRAVSAPAGVVPPMEEGAVLLHPRARKCRTVRDRSGATAHHIMSGDEYAENVRELVTDVGFFEVETAHESFVYGDIAHVISHYEGYADEALTRRTKKGVNSIQLLRVDGHWKVFSMIWDDEENLVIPSGS